MKLVTGILFCICILPAVALAQEPFKVSPANSGAGQV